MAVHTLQAHFIPNLCLFLFSYIEVAHGFLLTLNNDF